MLLNVFPHGSVDVRKNVRIGIVKHIVQVEEPRFLHIDVSQILTA